jgi:hypothetical protein
MVRACSRWLFVLGFGCSAQPEALDAQEPALEPAAKGEVGAPPAPQPLLAPDRQPEPPAAMAEQAPEASSPAPELEADAVPELLATAREVFVWDRPNASAKKLGYLRAGARLPRSSEPLGFEGCPGGYYRVAPEGYVCTGPFARIDLQDPRARLGRVRPDRDAALPYAYARSGPLSPMLYTRLPGPDELRAFERDYRRAAVASSPAGSGTAPGRPLLGLTSQPVPAELEQGRLLPAPYGRYEPTTSNTGRAVADSSFALLESYVHDGRGYALSADLLLLPSDRLEPIRPSSFHGLALDGIDLPVAFVMRRGAKLYAGHPSKGLRIARALDYREALPLTDQRGRVGSTGFRQTAAGDWIRDEGLIEVSRPAELPSFARGNTTWIRISIATQTLVAYEGERPVYVTLVSTGADGAGDPKTTRSTVLGQFRIHTKHVTARMDSDDPEDTYDHRDVPWVAYFSEGYALHAAYWHDAFGTPKSHGCVNLSPADARWLFQWSEPSVPRLWHGAMGAGTRVVVAL